MSFLTPLYILGFLGISLPLLFHLIRRTPKGTVPFSSLLFVTPTPPRLTRRSRLDQILLLLLRAAVIVLLALAFARPFWRGAASLDESQLHGRWVALLVDTSASMRRAGIWTAVQQNVKEILDELGPHDRVALYTFDNQVRPIVPFEETESLGGPACAELIERRLRPLGPGWAASHLGDALVQTAGELDAVVVERQPQPERQIVVVTDLQQGSDIQPLQRYQWPDNVRVSIRRVAPDMTGNATLRLLEQQPAAAGQAEQRVLVINAADSQQRDFTMGWSDDSGRPPADPVGVSVPPGESRVLRVPPPAAGAPATCLRLAGDGQDFDNLHFVVPRRVEAIQVAYAGAEQPDDPERMRFYLERGVQNDRQRSTRVVPLDAKLLDADEDARLAMVVIADELAPEELSAARAYLDEGGTVLYVVTPADDNAKTLAALMDREPFDVEQAEADDYFLLEQIDFQHHLFRALASPLFGDFTSIFFWRYRRLDWSPEDRMEVLARFDTGDPALIEQPREQGYLYVLTSGWHPDDSQFARSSKFVILLDRMLSRQRRATGTRHTVGDRVVLPPADDRGPLAVRKPDGTEVLLPTGETRFTQTDLPGIYTVRGLGDDYRFSVNLASAEADTAALDIAELERRGVRLGDGTTPAEQIEALRQMRDVELESRQSYWQWLIFAALLLLVLETVIAGRWSRLPASPLSADTA